MKSKQKRKYRLTDLYTPGNYDDLVRDILVDFSCLFDTDYGTVGYMSYKYAKSKYINPEVPYWTEYFAKCKILSREEINPLTIILKEEYKDQADNLYQELKEKCWKDVLKVSQQTDVLALIHGTFEYTGYSVTVNCNTQEEADYIKQIVPKWDTVIDQTKIDKFFCIFMHDMVKDLLTMKPMAGKSLYIYYHKPNFLNYKEHVPHQILAPFAPVNSIKIINPYKDIKFPYDMTPNDMEVKENGKEYRIK